MGMRMGFIARNDLAGLDEDAAFAAKHGIGGLEFNFWGNFKELTEDTVKQMRAILDKHGVKACMLGLWGWNHLDTDDAKRTEAHAMLDRAIDYAKLIGADVFVTGGGDMPDEKLGRKVKEFLSIFPPYMKKVKDAGMRMAFYAVHGASFFDGLPAYERVWEEMPEVTIKYDPANWCHHGDDYLEVVQKHGDKIGHVHIKEHLYMGGKLVSQPAAGMGDIAWGKVMAFLHEHNYEGWLSMEPHGPVWSKQPFQDKMVLLSKRYIEQFLI